MRRALLAITLLLAAGCGSDDSPQPLTVSAATSLKTALTDLGGARYSFGGSDELAAQIRQGVRPDVFAAANTKLPDQLYKEGLVERPRVFAANELVLAVRGDTIQSLDDLAKPGVKIAMGAPTVPVGSYTRTVLAALPAAQRKAILANVRSNEPDVGGVTGKVAQGAVDAGFVYATDVRAAGGELRAIKLPADLQPKVAYGVAVVKGAKHADAARKFIDGLVNGAGREALDRAGFLPPPGT